MRPTKARIIGCIPPYSQFHPVQDSDSKENGSTEMITVELDMLEAMRLVDVEGMSHERAAQSMGISSPTLCRILAKGRRLTAQALITGAIINIEGGNIMCNTQQDKQHRFCHRHGEMHGEHGSHGNEMGQKRCGKGKCEKNESNHPSSECDC